MVVTNAATGKLRVEIVDRPGETRIYDAQKRRVTVSRTSSTTPAYTSSAFESALHRAYVQQGIMRVAGERTVDGRRLLLLESVPGKWKSSDPGSRATALVDAQSYAVTETSSILDDGLFQQTVTNRVVRDPRRTPGGRGEARHEDPRGCKADPHRSLTTNRVMRRTACGP